MSSCQESALNIGSECQHTTATSENLSDHAVVNCRPNAELKQGNRRWQTSPPVRAQFPTTVYDDDRQTAWHFCTICSTAGDAENARHEIAGHENAAPECKGGKCET